MTIVSNVIRCDRYGCRTESAYEGELSSYEVRAQYAKLGWKTSGVEMLIDHCPLHQGASQLRI
jgi:hypothetical protein